VLYGFVFCLSVFVFGEDGRSAAFSPKAIRLANVHKIIGSELRVCTKKILLSAKACATGLRRTQKK